MTLHRILIAAMAILIWQGTETPSVCVVHLESVDYPTLALFARIQGDVAVKVQIASDGRVVSALATSGHPLLQHQAEENVKKWTFSAGTERNLDVLYEFRLQKPQMYRPNLRTTFDLPNRVVIVSNFLEPQS